MKLYYSAGSCSTSCHISLEASGLKYEAIEIDWDNANDPNLGLVEKLNPMGTLPILVTDDGKVLNQNHAIHEFIADQAPGKGLMPANGTWDRAEARNWLTWVASDLHKSFSAIWAAGGQKDADFKTKLRDFGVANVGSCLKVMDQHLAGRDFMTGKTFTAVDAYAFVVVGWTKWLDMPLRSYKNVDAYMSRVAKVPAVQAVLKAEGLLDG